MSPPYTPQPMLSILVATDSPILRDALRSIITPTKDMKLMGCIENHAELLSRARELTPDLVILDTSFVSDSLSSVIDTIVGRNSKVLLIGGEMDNAQIIDALFRGASGVIGRKSTADLVCRSIRAVVSGEFWVSRQVTSKLIEVLRTESQGNGGANPALARMLNRTNRPPAATSGDNKFGLTKRELQVIGALVEGQSNKDIAATFGVSEYTVKHHLTNVFDKLGVYNRLELVLFAIRHQLCISPDEAAVTTVADNSASTKKTPRSR
jgi:two-component system nitrate/nitrite response regulator NarL